MVSVVATQLTCCGMRAAQTICKGMRNKTLFAETGGKPRGCCLPGLLWDSVGGMFNRVAWNRVTFELGSASGGGLTMKRKGMSHDGQSRAKPWMWLFQEQKYLPKRWGGREWCQFNTRGWGTGCNGPHNPGWGLAHSRYLINQLWLHQRKLEEC